MPVTIEKLTPENIELCLSKRLAGAEDHAVTDVVRAIIEDVIARGDKAVAEYTRRFDGIDLTPAEFRVDPVELKEALAAIPKQIRADLELATGRIADFHRRQLPESWTFEIGGAVLGQKVTAVSRAGLYVPGGRASYPSSVLMNAIPARIAGVKEIALCVPPDKDGKVNPYVLAAAAIAGVDEIYKVGGAQAIAALAYGTDTIKAVDKITGPGNIYVATAKRLVIGRVDIDMIAGPTEVIIIADGRAPAAFIAADMIAQAEHDPLASAILLTDSRYLPPAVNEALGDQIDASPRAEIVRKSLAENGRSYIVDDFGTAVDFVNRYSPEHLEIMTEDPEALLPQIKNAGAIFLGDYTPEALGDYVAGSNHVLPTASTARFYSPLGVYDFLKWSSVLSFSREAMAAIGPAAVRLADIEGLRGHARSVELRLAAEDE
jgi:histidinol dehydrogenase